MMALAASAVVATAVCCALWCALSLAADRDREQRLRDLWMPRPSPVDRCPVCGRTCAPSSLPCPHARKDGAA